MAMISGLVRVMELAHKNHGKLPWARLFQPAITLAENGFAISRRTREGSSRPRQRILMMLISWT